MKARRSSIASSLGLLVVLAAAACGGGSSSDPQATSTPGPSPSPSPTPVREARLWVLASLADPDPLARPPAVLLYSDDLGATWQSLADSGLDGTTTAFDFLDASRGVAVGGGIVQSTTDGGRTWTTEFTDPSDPTGNHLELTGVQFDSSGTAIMLANAASDSYLNASSYVSFRLPADGAPIEKNRVDAEGGARIGSMCTTASGVGIGVGGFRFSIADLAYSTTLGTRDAGASWQVWDTISGGGLTWYGTACAGEQDLWRFGFAHRTLDPSLGGFVIDHSEDGGRTWAGPVDRDAIGSGDLAAASFTDRSTGWFAGARDAAPLILYTTDAGATLVAQATPAGVSGGLGAIAFIDDRVGVAGGSFLDPVASRIAPLILVTRDGGEAWTIASIPPGLSTVVDVDVTP